MKIFILILLSLFVVSCESITEGCNTGTTSVSKIRVSTFNWEEHFGVTYEELKVIHEGTYETEEEVWYRGEKRILTFYVKINENAQVWYQTGECGDMYRVPIWVQSDTYVIYRGDCNKNYLNESIKPYTDELTIMNSEYVGCRENVTTISECNTFTSTIKKISDEIPAELNWECNGSICE